MPALVLFVCHVASLPEGLSGLNVKCLTANTQNKVNKRHKVILHFYKYSK